MELENRSIQQLHADVIADTSSMEQFSNLLDTCFNVPKGCHYFDDFPVWNSMDGILPLLKIGVFQKKKLVSSTAVRLGFLNANLDEASRRKVTFKSPASIAIIGAVATDPHWRGLGLASRTVSLAVQWAKERGASLAMLWTARPQFYRRLGFELCGTQFRIPLRDLKILVEPAAQVYRGWVPSLFKLKKMRTGGFLLTDADRKWFEAHKNVDWMYIGNSDNPKAYVGIGRGLDLKGVIHEWGGEQASLLSLLQFLRSNDPNLLLLCSPHHERELGTSLAKGEPEPLCLAKILDPEKLIRDFYPYEEQIPKITFQEDHWEILDKLQISHRCTDQELTRLILGSPTSHEKKVGGLFPLPLWIWGLDAS